MHDDVDLFIANCLGPGILGDIGLKESAFVAYRAESGSVPQIDPDYLTYGFKL